MRIFSAVVFPGQGSQRPEMGKDFYSEFAICKQTFEEASDALGWDVATLCFSDDDRLNLTEFTQPCLLTAEIAALRGLSSRYGLAPALFGGHSLGEFTALVASSSLPLCEAVKAVHVRGQLMQKAVPVGVGGMAAVIAGNLDIELLHKTLSDLPIDVANANSINQVVISGQLAALPEAEKRLRSAYAQDESFRFVTLNVSAPFHSRYMNPIETIFAETLMEKKDVFVPSHATAVTSNFTGQFHDASAESIIGNMVSQLSNTVRWVDNMRCLAEKADVIYEIGPSRPLREFFKTINVTCTSITSLSTAERAFRESN